MLVTRSEGWICERYWDSLLRKGLFVLWGSWGERKRGGAGHDGKREQRREAPFSLFPSSPARIKIPGGSLCGGERYWNTGLLGVGLWMDTINWACRYVKCIHHSRSKQMQPGVNFDSQPLKIRSENMLVYWFQITQFNTCERYNQWTDEGI